MINIAELLKDAPMGMKLYSPLFGEVEFAEVMDTDYVPIRVMKRGYRLRFDEYGRYMGNEYPDSESLLFPSKDCRTWEGWKLPVEPNFKVGDWVVKKDVTTFYGGNYAEQITLIEGDGYLKCIWLSSGTWLRDNDIRLWTIADAKDGDTLVSPDGSIIIYAGKIADNGLLYYYVALNKYKNLRIHEQISVSWLGQETAKPATREQRDMFFAKIKEEGYEWDSEKKELKKIQPHYDISNFHAGIPVLVREYDTCVWQWVQYSHFNGVGLFFAAGKTWRQCIPFN